MPVCDDALRSKVSSRFNKRMKKKTMCHRPQHHEVKVVEAAAFSVFVWTFCLWCVWGGGGYTVGKLSQRDADCVESRQQSSSRRQRHTAPLSLNSLALFLRCSSDGLCLDVWKEKPTE